MQAYNDFNNYRTGQPIGGGGAYTDQWGNPRQGTQLGFVEPPPVRGYGNGGGPGDGYGYADQASMIAPPNGANWHQQQLHQTGHYSSGTSPLGYNDYNHKANNHKASKYNKHGEKSSDMYDDQYRKKESSSSYDPAINMISNMVSSRVAQPSRTSTRASSRLPIPTDDMERALHYVREYSKSSPWPRT